MLTVNNSAGEEAVGDWPAAGNHDALSCRADTTNRPERREEPLKNRAHTLRAIELRYLLLPCAGRSGGIYSFTGKTLVYIHACPQGDTMLLWSTRHHFSFEERPHIGLDVSYTAP